MMEAAFHRRMTKEFALSFLLILVVALSCSACTQKDDAVEVNENLDHVVAFSLTAEPGTYDSSVQGNVFIYGEQGSAQAGSLVATFNIDQNDPTGIEIAIPEGVHVKSITWSYPDGQAGGVDVWGRPFAEFFQTAGTGGGGVVFIAYSYPSVGESPSGGGSGSIVIDFSFAADDLKNPFLSVEMDGRDSDGSDTFLTHTTVYIVGTE
jgi:hypothetical protein